MNGIVYMYKDFILLTLCEKKTLRREGDGQGLLRDVPELVRRAVQEAGARVQGPDRVRVLRRAAPDGRRERQDRAQGLRLQLAGARLPHQRQEASHAVGLPDNN